MSILTGHVIVWDEVRSDMRVFDAASVINPVAVVGSVVSARLNYHQPVGLVTEAVNDEIGCRVTVQLDFGKGRDRSMSLTPVYVAKDAVQLDGGVIRVKRAFLLHVSLGS